MPLSLTARYGPHRVHDGDGTFPQPAWKLDADPRISDASGDPAAVARTIEGIVPERGKLHNPATGSGGMLVGTVREVGSTVRESRRVAPGQRIASLISLTLTPLRLDRIDGVEMHHGQVDACGTAADATDALGLYEAVMDAAGREADVAVNLVNVPGTELGTILVTRESGTILFFSMATSFTTAALGAEGLGRATTMLIGNGHMPDMGLTALNVLRESPAVRAVFERRYAA